MQKKQKKQAAQHLPRKVRNIMMHVPEIKEEYFNQ
jgi:hypothetical protein